MAHIKPVQMGLFQWILLPLSISFFLSPLIQAEEGMDYSLYAQILKIYVDPQGRVDYQGLKDNRENLDAFIAKVGRMDGKEFESWNEPDRIAFLINIYNALTLKAILDHYPIKARSEESPKNSIQQIEGVWDQLKFRVLGREETLNQIEHEDLRQKFNEPRIHMALVCGAQGCPWLRNEPYSGKKLQAQLEDQTQSFLLHPEKFRVDEKKREVHVSQIFNWFGEDFVKTYGTHDRFKGRQETERAILNFISRYLEGEKKRYLLEGDYDLQYLHYDWNLNGK